MEDGSESWERIELEDDPDMPELIPVDDDDDPDVPGLATVDDDDDPDMPELVLVDDEDDQESIPVVVPAGDAEDPGPAIRSDSMVVERVHTVLLRCQPFPGDEIVRNLPYPPEGAQFFISLQEFRLVEIYDRVQGFETRIHQDLLNWDEFSLGKWFAERCAHHSLLPFPWKEAHEWMSLRDPKDTTMGLSTDPFNALPVAGIQVDKNKYPSLRRDTGTGDTVTIGFRLCSGTGAGL